MSLCTQSVHSFYFPPRPLRTAPSRFHNTICFGSRPPLIYFCTRNPHKKIMNFASTGRSRHSSSCCVYLSDLCMATQMMSVKGRIFTVREVTIKNACVSFLAAAHRGMVMFVHFLQYTIYNLNIFPFAEIFVFLSQPHHTVQKGKCYALLLCFASALHNNISLQYGPLSSQVFPSPVLDRIAIHQRGHLQPPAGLAARVWSFIPKLDPSKTGFGIKFPVSVNSHTLPCSASVL